jgi:transcriptional regulator with XRE-family HTH domain
MPKKKLGIREILALNLKLNRKKCGLTQEKLAEKAGISANYLSMVEISKKFPTPEMLDRLAEALRIDAIQLFNASFTPEESDMLHLEQSILANIEKAVRTGLKQYENEHSIKGELEQLRQEIIQDIKNNYNDRLEKSIVFNIENVVKMSVKQAVASELKNLKKGK